MDLDALARRHGQFFVPGCTALVGGEDLVRDLHLSVTSVEVDLEEKTAGRFTIKIANAFDWERRQFVAGRGQEVVDLIELFAFGAPVDLRFGYGEPTQHVSLLTGIVTEVSTSFASGSTPELTVAGFDKLYPLTTGKLGFNLENKPDSAAVERIAAAYALDTNVVRTAPDKPRIDQSQESDLAMLTKLAERNPGTTFYLRGDKLYFGPRRNDAGELVELGWGKGLLGFSPELNLAEQVSTVEVVGRSLDGEDIVGRAGRGDETGRESRRQSGAERVATAIGKPAVMRVRAAVHSEAEATARAQAILEERAQQFLTGNVETIGLPEIVPDINVALTGLGVAFSKTYYVSAATHGFDSGGYRTTCKVQETTC
jgi:uncharacterized protein